MALPFVRELFADVEKLPAFSRVASRLKENTGRARVSGLTPTAKALLLVLLQRAMGRPFLVIVNDNRAAEDGPGAAGVCRVDGFGRSGVDCGAADARRAAVPEPVAASRDPGGAGHGAVEGGQRGGLAGGGADSRDDDPAGLDGVLHRPGQDHPPGRDVRYRRSAAAPEHRG